jgi:hypothetical protein
VLRQKAGDCCPPRASWRDQDEARAVQGNFSRASTALSRSERPFS